MRGFSLLELVLVFAVVTIAAAVSAPVVARSIDAARARAEVGAVITFLRSARVRAVTRGEATEVAIDGRVHALVVRRAGARDGTPTTRVLSPLLQVAADRVPVTFLPQGTSSGGRLAIEAPGPRTYVVTVDALTGRVSLGRGGP